MSCKNVLLILVDQVIASTLEAYGGQCKTPNLKKLAKRGVVFKNAYTTVPLCSPARASLFTGMYPHKHGILYNTTGAAYGRLELPDAGTMISGPLARKGVNCAYFGKWHIGEKMGPTKYGFEGTSHAGYGLPSNYVEEYDEFLNENGHPGMDHVEAKDVIASVDLPSIKFPMGKNTPKEIKGCEIYAGILDLPSELSPAGFVASRTIDKLKAVKDKPFFITSSFWGPHHPALPSAEFAGTHEPENITEWGSFKDDFSGKPAINKRYAERLHCRFNKEAWPLWQKVIALHYDFMTMIDAQIGRILNVLEAQGLADDTLVIFSADHGDSLGCHGGQWDKGPYAYDEVTKVPLIISGPGTAPGLKSDSLASNMDIYSTVLDFCGAEIPQGVDSVSLLPELSGQNESVRDAIFSHFYGFDVRGLFLQRMVRMGDWKYAYNPSSTDELYNLSEDPDELNNLLDAPEAAEHLKLLQKRLSLEMNSTNDPYAHFADDLMGLH